MKPERILEDFERALGQLATALETPADTDLIKAGCIQYFEFCFELAWKAIKAVAAKLGLECNSPRACLKLAFQQGWIDDEDLWLEMLAARNRMSHTYHAENALAIYAQLPAFHQALRQLSAQLRNVEV
ncbi:HI0074 family nucleotidyltransferase substrate-binding subunit [Methylothermus subterraneus]